MAVQTLTTASFESAPRLYHECHRLLAICKRIFNMKCHSSCITVYSFGQLILNLTSSVAPLNECTLLSSILPPCTCYATNLKKVLFSHFVTTLNDTFEGELTLADEGYESRSETSNLATPLRRTSRIYHISSNKNISFNPSTPCTTATSQSHCKPACC